MEGCTVLNPLPWTPMPPTPITTLWNLVWQLGRAGLKTILGV